MSKCDIRIELDRPRPFYQMGETITGAVVVTVNKRCACKKLTLAVNWQTHGKGNRRNSNFQPQILFVGDWEAGQEHRYPFQLAAPSGPVTYHGRILNLDWMLQARADIPWAIDPKASHEMVLLPGPTSNYNAGRNFTQPVDPSKVTKKGISCLFYMGLFTLVAAGVVGLGAGLELWFVYTPIALMALLLMAAGLWRKMAESKVGLPRVAIDSIHPMAGENVDVTVQVAPRKTITFDKVVIKLQGQEVAVRGSGTNKTTYTESIYGMQAEQDLSQPTLNAGETRTFGGRFLIPRDAGPSLAVSDGQVKWWVEVHVGIASWPDWKQRYPLGVLPAV